MLVSLRKSQGHGHLTEGQGRTARLAGALEAEITVTRYGNFHRQKKRPKLFSLGRLGSPPPELPNHELDTKATLSACKCHFGNALRRLQVMRGSAHWAIARGRYSGFAYSVKEAQNAHSPNFASLSGARQGGQNQRGKTQKEYEENPIWSGGSQFLPGLASVTRNPCLMIGGGQFTVLHVNK